MNTIMMAAWNTMDTYTVEIMDEDTRTIDYLKSIGIELRIIN